MINLSYIYFSVHHVCSGQLLPLTSGEVALLPYTDLGGVDQVANGDGPPHRGSYAGVTGASLVHLQQGQV